MAREGELPEKGHDDNLPHLLDYRFYRHANQPRNMGVIPDADGKATGVGVCGDSIDIFLSIKNHVIGGIGQIPHGCIYTVACGSAVGQLVYGKHLEDALKVTPEDVAEELGGLPEDHMHCASLAVNTLGEAIDDYYSKEWGNSGKQEIMMKKFLIITRQAGNFLKLAEWLSDKNANEILWADSVTAAHVAAAGSIDLIIIDEKVDGQPGPDVAKKMIRVNAMANLALVSELSPEEFHEASEGLGIMAQLPPCPDAKDAERLLNALTALS